MLPLNGDGAQLAPAVVESLNKAAGRIHQLEHGLLGLNRVVVEGHSIYHGRRLCWTFFFFKNMRMMIPHIQVKIDHTGHAIIVQLCRLYFIVPDAQER